MFAAHSLVLVTPLLSCPQALASEALLRIILHSASVDGSTPADRRYKCETLWEQNATMEHPDNICGSDDPALGMYGLLLLPSVLRAGVIPVAPMLFWSNTDAVALHRLLTEPRVLIIMMQARANTIEHGTCGWRVDLSHDLLRPR